MPSSDQHHLPPPGSLLEPATPELLELRLATASISLGAAGGHPEPAREALKELSLRANRAIRAVDLGTTDDLLSGHCFAARALVAEVRRTLAAQPASPAKGLEALAKARRSLYRALCLVARSLARLSAERVRALTRQSDVVEAPRGGMHDLSRFAANTSHGEPSEIAWLLEVAESEIALAAADARHFELPRAQRDELAALHGAIVAWSSGTREPAEGLALAARLLEAVGGARA